MIDNNWVMGCMHVVRGLFNKQRNLHGIHEAIVGLYGKHEFAPTAMQVVVMATQQQPQEDPESGPGVYRTSNNNFLRFICDVFRYLDLKRILGSIWRSQQQGQPGTVCQLSPCASQMVSWMVETKQPGTPVQTRWLRELSVSEQGIQCIEQVYDQFVRRANERDVAQVLEGLSRVDYQLCAQFFYTLQRHYACRHLALDADLTAQQVRVRRRIYQVPPEQPHLDRHLSLAFYCNTMACNELKHTVVQDRGNAKFYGTKQLLYDAQRDAFFCASKKTVGMRQRNKQKIRAYTGSEPEFIARAKAGELEAFCLVYTSMDDLFSGASNIEAPSSAPAAGNGKANTGVHITVDGKRLRIDTIDEPAPARVATTRIVQLRNRIDRYRALLKKLNVPVTDGDLDSLMEPKTDTLAPEQREEVKLALDQLIAEGKKEAKAIYKMIYHRPCYHMPAFSTPLVGYVICKEKQKDKQKTKSSTQPITVCTQCGSVTHFSLAEQYSTNGYALYPPCPP